MIQVIIRGSRLDGRSYRMEHIPSVGDSIQDDGDIIEVQRRVFQRDVFIELYCVTVKSVSWMPVQ